MEEQAQFEGLMSDIPIESFNYVPISTPQIYNKSLVGADGIIKIKADGRQRVELLFVSIISAPTLSEYSGLYNGDVLTGTKIFQGDGGDSFIQDLGSVVSERGGYFSIFNESSIKNTVLIIYRYID